MRTPLRKDMRSPIDIDATRITILEIKQRMRLTKEAKNKYMTKISIRYFRGKVRTDSIVHWISYGNDVYICSLGKANYKA